MSKHKKASVAGARHPGAAARRGTSVHARNPKQGKRAAGSATSKRLQSTGSAASKRPQAAGSRRTKRRDADASARKDCYSFGTECTVSTAADLKDSLSRLLHETGPVTLDATALRTIDTAAIQVVASFVRERAAGTLAVQWRGVAAPLLTAAHLLGLTTLLQLPAAGTLP